MAGPFYARYIPPTPSSSKKVAPAVSKSNTYEVDQQSLAAASTSKSKKKRKRGDDVDARDNVDLAGAPEEDGTSVKKAKKNKDREKEEKRRNSHEHDDARGAQDDSNGNTLDVKPVMKEVVQDQEEKSNVSPIKKLKRKKKAKAEAAEADDDQVNEVETKHKAVYAKFQKSSQKAEHLRKKVQDEVTDKQDNEEEPTELYGVICPT